MLHHHFPVQHHSLHPDAEFVPFVECVRDGFLCRDPSDFRPVFLVNQLRPDVNTETTQYTL